VTLLTDFEAASSSMDWTLGTHGLRISFVYHGRKMGATYLPDVPVEQGWTKEETVASLMRKAGWTGRKEEWEKVKLNVVRYKGTKATVSYEEYRELIDGASEVKRTGGLHDDDDEGEEEDEESEEED
jgi:AMMECR1 domain-containing protein